MTNALPTRATVGEIEIDVVTFTHDDYTQAHEVRIRNLATGQTVCSPTWKHPTEQSARDYANLAWKAAHLVPAGQARPELWVRSLASDENRLHARMIIAARAKAAA